MLDLEETCSGSRSQETLQGSAFESQIIMKVLRDHLGHTLRTRGLLKPKLGVKCLGFTQKSRDWQKSCLANADSAMQQCDKALEDADSRTQEW